MYRKESCLGIIGKLVAWHQRQSHHAHEIDVGNRAAVELAEEALEQVDKVLALENEFKRAHFRLLIAIKNELREEQIDMIDQHLSQRRSESKRQ